MIHREVFQRVGLFDPQMTVCEDYDLWLRITPFYEVGFVTTPGGGEIRGTFRSTLLSVPSHGLFSSQSAGSGHGIGYWLQKLLESCRGLGGKGGDSLGGLPQASKFCPITRSYSITMKWHKVSWLCLNRGRRE